MMTPLEPLAPYMEFAAASLSTVIDSMSWVGMEFRLPSYGTPSTTRSGDCDADTEPSPRMMMLAEEPGVPDELDVCRPATAPSSDLDVGRLHLLQFLSADLCGRSHEGGFLLHAIGHDYGFVNGL